MNSRNPGVRIFQTEKAISSTNYVSLSRLCPLRLAAFSHLTTSNTYRSSPSADEYRYTRFDTNKILIDRETGYVLISGMWKALGRIKADVIKLIESQPKIAPVVRKIRGGVLDIQLIPIFGPLFPSTCLAPDAPGFGDLVLSEPQAAKTASNPELREKARQAAHAAQNNSRVSTITQASQAKTSYRTSLEADDESELAPPLTGNARSQPPPLGPLFTTSPLPNSREERRPQQDPRVGPARPSWKGYKAPLRRPQLSPANSLPSRLSPYPAVRHPPTTHLQYDQEKPYDRDSDQSSDEDFVNAAATPRPSSRASAASGGSKSTRKPQVVLESSSESIDSEEERELQEELRDAAGTETGVVRGAPVQSTTERIMRSVGKGSSSQRYASLGRAEEGAAGRSSGRRHSHHGKGHKSRKKRAEQASAYSLADPPTSKTIPKGFAAGSVDPALAGASQKDAKKSKKTWLWVLLIIIALIVVAAIIAAVVILVKRKSGDSSEDLDSASNSTSLSDHANSTSSADLDDAHNASSNAMGTGHGSTHLPVGGTNSETASPVNTFDDGKYHPSTGSAAVPSASDAQATLGRVESDAHATLSGAQAATATGTVESLASGSVQSGPSLGASSGVPAQTQVYGIPSSVSGVDGASESGSGLAGAAAPAATGSTVADAVESIQTVPNPIPSGGSDQAGQQAGSPASNAGQWNSLSGDAAQSAALASPSVFAATSQPWGSPSSSLNLGVGPVVPSATQGGVPTGAAIIGGGAIAGAGAYNNGQYTNAGAPAPVDSTAPGPFTSAEFKQATHPENFQIYVNSPGTWFQSSGHYGACGLATNNTDFVVAINNALWLNSTKGSETAQSPYCGAEVLLTSMTNGATVNAWVTERCAYCSVEGTGGIDLSKATFEALAGGTTDLGTLNLVWGFTGNQSTGTSTTSTATNTSTEEAEPSSTGSSWFFGGGSDESSTSAESDTASAT
ncbi:hypothetical protein JCM16303_005723 [Sporobolomyces ruberrimus]